MVPPTGCSKANVVAPAGVRTARSLACFDIVSSYFVLCPKIDMLCCKLRTIVSHYKGALRPSVMARYNSHTRPSPPCNVRRRFSIVSRYFVERPKIDTSQTKIRMALLSLVGVTNPCSRCITTVTLAPPPFGKHNAVRRRLRDEMMVFCRKPKNRHKTLQTADGLIVARRCHTPLTLTL